MKFHYSKSVFKIVILLCTFNLLNAADDAFVTQDGKTISLKELARGYAGPIPIAEEKLEDAVLSGDAEKVIAAIEDGACIKCERRNDPLLHAAIRSGHANVVKVLIEKEADIEIKNSEGMTPLIYVCNRHEKLSYEKLTDAFYTLLKAGANVNAQDHFKFFALYHAARYGNLQFVKSLVARKADLELKDITGTTALQRAVGNGHESVVEFLLKSGANVNTFNNDGNTPLMRAVTRKFNIYKLLLNANVTIEQKNNKGETALHLAVSHNNEAASKDLLGKGANPNVQDNEGWTPLMLAAKHGFNSMDADLVAAKANIHLKNNQGQTALMIAQENDHKVSITLLVSSETPKAFLSAMASKLNTVMSNKKALLSIGVVLGYALWKWTIRNRP